MISSPARRPRAAEKTAVHTAKIVFMGSVLSAESSSDLSIILYHVFCKNPLQNHYRILRFGKDSVTKGGKVFFPEKIG